MDISTGNLIIEDGKVKSWVREGKKKEIRRQDLNL